MTSKTTIKFSPEVRDRSVRMGLDHEKDHVSRWGGRVSIVEKLLRAANPERVAEKGLDQHTQARWRAK